MICHKNLIAPFTMFLINDDYRCAIGAKDTVNFTKPNKPQLKVDRHGNMNDAAVKRYEVFLKMWLRHGKVFVERLSAQSHMLMVR